MSANGRGRRIDWLSILVEEQRMLRLSMSPHFKQMETLKQQAELVKSSNHVLKEIEKLARPPEHWAKLNRSMGLREVTAKAMLYQPPEWVTALKKRYDD